MEEGSFKEGMIKKMIETVYSTEAPKQKVTKKRDMDALDVLEIENAELKKKLKLFDKYKDIIDGYEAEEEMQEEIL